MTDALQPPTIEPNPVEAARIRKRLKPKQYQAAALLAAGRNVIDTAMTVQVNPSTIHRWMNRTAFMELVELCRAVELESKRAQLAKHPAQ